MGNCKILIVEDSTIQGLGMKTILSNNGYQVIDKIATTREEAIELALKEHPHVIIMDIYLWGINFEGIEAALYIQEKIYAHIIYVTGAERSGDLMNLVKKTKSFDFLIKPVREDQLLTTLSFAAIRKKDKNLVFVSYSRADTDMAEEMVKFLTPLSKDGIDTWVDTKIDPGADWKKEIMNSLSVAKAAVLLVSIDFLTSNFIMDVELPKLLANAKSKGTLILPAFIRSVPEKTLVQTKILDFQGINKHTDPMILWNQAKREQYGWTLLFEILEKKLFIDVH